MLSLHESPINMQIYGKSLMKMLSVFRIESQLSGGTEHSVIGDNLLGLFLKRKWVIRLFKRCLIGVKTHLDKHIKTLVMTFRQLTYVRLYYLGTIAAGKSFSKKYRCRNVNLARISL